METKIFSVNKAIFWFLFVGVLFICIGSTLAWIVPVYTIQNAEISVFVVLGIFGGIICAGGIVSISFGIVRTKQKFEFNKIEKNGEETIGKFVAFGRSIQVGGLTNTQFGTKIKLGIEVTDKDHGTQYYSIKFKFVNSDEMEIVANSFTFFIKSEAERLKAKKTFKIRYIGNKAVIVE